MSAHPPRGDSSSADIIIVGAGAAGLFCALVAARRGASVIILERDLHGPSNLLVSGGLFPGAGTRFQREAGVADSPEQFAADVTAKAQGIVDPPILAAIARKTAPAIDFLIDEIGLPVKWLPDLQVPGHSVPRMHATPKESGRELHQLMREAVGREARIRVVADAEGSGLITEAGVVVGAQARISGQTVDFKARAVLLASGGFASNQAMLAEFIPEMAGAMHIGAGANDGCSVMWARALGADVAFMQGYQGQGHVNPGGKTRLGMALPSLGAFMVNKTGRRFVAEDIGPSELGAFVLAQPDGVALEVFDQRIHETASRQGPYREACEAGHVQEAATPEELALRFGMDPQVFAKTFADFADFVRAGFDPDQGRKRFGPVLAPPYRASWVTGALAHTQGGVRVDTQGRVVRPDGSPILGLFAAGGAAASISGIGGAGYLPGNGLAQSFGLGLMCGEQMAAAARAITARS
jgi:fumarate reductase flavoprotein subunit